MSGVCPQRVGPSSSQVADPQTDSPAPDHLDPFDRLLVAQARAGGFVLVSADPQFHACDGIAYLDARAARRRSRKARAT